MAPMRMPSKGTPGASDLLSRVSGVRMFHQAIGGKEPCILTKGSYEHENRSRQSRKEKNKRTK